MSQSKYDSTIVFFKYKKIAKPIIKIKEIRKRNELIIAFIPFMGEHITLHLQNDGSILRTHWNKNKQKSVWDDMRIEVAKHCGYRDPIRHGQYYIHSPLVKINNIHGYHLVGRRILFSKIINGTSKGDRDVNKVFMNIPFQNFMLNLYLSTPDNKRIGKYKIVTSFGDIIFNF